MTKDFVISPKKQLIVNAAAELFRTKGYNASSMRDLAQKVGIEASSIYSHIKSKEELLSYICLDCAYAFTRSMADLIDEVALSPTDKLIRLISLHIDMAYDNPSSISVFNDEWRYLQPDAMKEFLALRQKYAHDFNQVLRQGHETGEFTFTKQEIIFNVIIKTITWSYDAQKKHSRQALKEELTHFVINALK